MPNLSIGAGAFNFAQRIRPHSQRGFVAAIGSGTATFTGLAATVLVEPVRIAEEPKAELVDESERLGPVVEGPVYVEVCGGGSKPNRSPRLGL
jgi:hypothetical protein